MTQSSYHDSWYIYDLENWIIPAIENDRLVILYSDHGPIGFYTYTFLTKDAEFGYLTKTKSLTPEDWTTEQGDGTLYVIDFMALESVRNCVKLCRNHLHQLFGDKEDFGYFFRRAKGRLGKIAKKREELCWKMAS